MAMKYFLFLLLLLSALSSNDKAHTFAPSKDCQACHPQIYSEFVGSMHANSIPEKDPIHNAVWEKHPQNIKLQRYECDKCANPDLLKTLKLENEAIASEFIIFKEQSYDF